MIFDKLLTTPNQVLQTVFDSIESKKSLHLTYLNQHSFNVYIGDKIYRKLLEAKFVVYQADLGIYFALKYLFRKKIIRIDATAMNTNILNELIRRKIKPFIIGGHFHENLLIDDAKLRGLDLAGYHNGYFEESQISDIIQKIYDINCQVFIIGMGVPKQELFAEQLIRTSNERVIICVGNFLEFYFGTKKRAPYFLQKIGFEWMFRLLSEPKRLWRRYLLGIPLFIYRVIKIKLGIKVI